MSEPVLAPIAAADWAAALGLVIRLHDREADAELLALLAGADPGALFAGLLNTPAEADALTALSAALRDLAGQGDGSAALDEIAVDFCDIYLTHGYRIAPSGSVWMTEEHLERQAPMFAVREWYAYYGLAVPDWRLRADDHLVHELQFVQHLLCDKAEFAATDAARFLDAHALPWIPDFCAAMQKRARTPFYRATGALTQAFLGALRDWLAETTGIAPNVLSHAFAREADRKAREDELKAAEQPFVPGLAESW